jgi:hypothetical protein
MMGRITESYRLPMIPVQASTRARLQKVVTELGLLEVENEEHRVARTH